jgi:hypothetical protein
MDKDSLSRSMRPKVLHATLTNLKAERTYVEAAQATKKDAGQPTDAEDLRIKELDLKIDAVVKQLSSSM